MITPIYTSTRYSPDAVTARYVRKAIGSDGYEWCEVGGDRRYDVRQGTCDASDVPEAIRSKADALAGYAYAYVDWPQ